MHAHAHRTGMSTPASCSVAVKLLKTVAERGEHAMWLKEAHTDYLEGHDRRSFLFYMQAAEQVRVLSCEPFALVYVCVL
jgi:hypothetical protein